MKTRNFIMCGMVLLAACVSAQTPEEAVHFMENEDGVGVKAMAMGNASVGAADDYTALYWNPASLTLLKTSEMSCSFYRLHFKNETAFAGNTVLGDQNFTKLKSLGLAYKFPTSRGSLVLAVGYNRFKDYDNFMYFSGFNTLSNGLEFELEDGSGAASFYRFDRDVLQTEQIIQDGNLSAWSVGGGIAMSPRFSLGITFNFYSGSSDYLFEYFQDDVSDVYDRFPADFACYELYQSIYSKFRGWGIKLGGLFEVSRHFRVGLAMDLPTSLRVLETYAARDVLIFDDDYVSEMDLGSGEWEYVVKYPVKISGGVTLDMQRLMLTGTFEYRDWSEVRFDVPSGYSLNEDFSDLLGENSHFPALFRPVLSYGVGGEFRVPGSDLKLRGGYRVVPSPFFGADGIEDRRYFCGGLGYNLDRYTTIDLGYIHGLWERDTADSYTPGGTHESIQTDRFLAGISYRF